MKSADELVRVAQNGRWFIHCGTATPAFGVQTLRSLPPWGDAANADERDSKVADQMEWLPTDMRDIGPIHGDTLQRMMESGGFDMAEIQGEHSNIRKAVSAAIGFQERPALKAGPNDFLVSARRMAMCAFVNALSEIKLDAPGWWVNAVGYYSEGFWPCGLIVRDRIMVVY